MPTIAAPHMMEDPKMQAWIKAFRDKYHEAPEDYTITAYDAADVMIQAHRQGRRDRQAGHPGGRARRSSRAASSRPCRARSRSTRTVTC